MTVGPEEYVADLLTMGGSRRKSHPWIAGLPFLPLFPDPAAFSRSVMPAGAAAISAPRSVRSPRAVHAAFAPFD